MIDRTRIPGQDGDNRPETEEFFHRLVTCLVVARLHLSRSQGLGDDAIRGSVLAFALERTSGIGESGFPPELRRETLVLWIERALEDALADPGDQIRLSINPLPDCQGGVDAGAWHEV